MNSNPLQLLLRELLKRHSLEELADITDLHPRTLYRVKSQGAGSRRTYRHLLNCYCLNNQQGQATLPPSIIRT